MKKAKSQDNIDVPIVERKNFFPLKQRRNTKFKSMLIKEELIKMKLSLMKNNHE